MAHFQLGHSSLFPGGTRLFVKGNSGEEKIVIHTGNQITLELVGRAKASGKPQIIALPAPSGVSVSELPAIGDKWRFTVKAHSGGMATLVTADATTAWLYVYTGPFRNHPGMARDLLAEVFRGSDPANPAKMQAIARMLHNDPDNLFNENSAANINRWGPLACGTVAKVGGRDLINSKTDYVGDTFHKPIKKDGPVTRADVLYDPGTIEKVMRAIKKRLEGGEPVLVSLAYDVKSMSLKGGSLVHTGAGGHTVLIVGCNAGGTEFLYVDPYGASKLKYAGGPAGLDPFPKKCAYLGVLHVWKDPVRNIDVLRSRPDTQAPGGVFDGDQYLEVILGPLS